MGDEFAENCWRMLPRLVLAVPLVELHQDVEDVHEKVDDVHVQLDGSLDVIIHLQLVGDAPGVVHQVGAEDGGASKGDDQAHDSRVQGREEAAQEPESEEPKGKRPKSRPEEGEVPLGAEGVDRQSSDQSRRDDGCLGHERSHPHGASHSGHDAHVQGHDSSQESQAEEVQGVGVLARVAEEQRQAGGDQRAPSECRGPVHHKAHDGVAQGSAAKRRCEGSRGHLA
mmetsp:Transcript_4063/g.7389  ORF Transcript_4063/g.7389 Transcript_4063/m.7389 type:complete len:226 (-) Transcript_4063:175-852(-)